MAAAARLLDQPEGTAQRLLERLVDAQLLETPRPGRYQFHDLVRLYARQHAQSRHPDPKRLPALIRLLAFYTATAWHTLTLLRPGDRRAATADPRWTDGGVQFPDASAALVWSEAERANLVAAIPQADGAAPAIPAELACQLTQALFGFFYMRGYWQDGAQANHTAVGLARRTHDLAAQAHADNNLGIFYWLLGRYAEAIACQQDSLTIFRKLGDRRGEVTSLGNLGVVYLQLGQHDEAIACQRDSLTIFRELGDRHGEAETLRDLGDALRAVGRDLQAGAAWQEALAICEALQIPEADEIRERLATLPSEVAEPPGSE